MKNFSPKEIFDVAVVGGGPAGLIAAWRAAELGAKVILLEKNDTPGKKLLLTGKGRCNFTQAKFETREFIEALGEKKAKFLFSSFSQFGSREIIDFFEKNGIKTKIENDSRVFPENNRSESILNILLSCLKNNRVEIRLGQRVLGFKEESGKIDHLKLPHSQLQAKNFILATGGKSFPALGSTGDGFSWVKQLGHSVTNPTPALSPIITQENWVKSLQGLSLQNVGITVFKNNQKQVSGIGKILFTHFGLSGPAILNLSKHIGKLLLTGSVFLEIDLDPTLNHSQLEKKIEHDFRKNNNKHFKNYLPEIIPPKIIPIFLRLTKIDPQKKINLITKEEKKQLVNCLKGLRIGVKKLLGWENSMVTAGGVSLKEVSPRTMQSKIIPNLFFAGEILDLDGPTGGYNLQICWSTGYAAGTAAVSHSIDKNQRH